MKSLGNPRFSNFSDFSKMTRLMTKNYTILLLDIVIFFLSLKKGAVYLEANQFLLPFDKTLMCSACRC